jgi:hypothetical protein
LSKSKIPPNATIREKCSDYPAYKRNKQGECRRIGCWLYNSELCGGYEYEDPSKRKVN